MKNNTSGSLVETIDYKYDAFGEEIEQDVTPAGGSTTATKFAYNGWNSNMPAGTGNANFQQWAILNGDNSLQTRNIDGRATLPWPGSLLVGNPTPANARDKLPQPTTATVMVTGMTSYDGGSLVATTAEGYDSDGNVTSIYSTNAGSTTLQDYSYSYNSLDQLSAQIENGVTLNFGYDGTGQLTQVSTPAPGASPYTFDTGYDANGNRDTGGTTVGVDNELRPMAPGITPMTTMAT